MNTCTKCKKTFELTKADQDFYAKIKVSSPTACPQCREQRRLAFRNERHLYKRKCDLCQKQILSIYSPDKTYTVYCPDCWWSDKWDPLQFGLEYDFNRAFFEQFNELMHKVPQLALMNVKCENSDYTNQSYGNKNCYMTIATDLSEDCYYVDYSFSCTNCVDSLGLHECQYCYQCIDCTKSYQCYYSQDLSSCYDCYFSRSLRNCRYCFGCTNLRNKEYYIFNEPVSKKEWNEKIGKLQLTQNIIAQMKKRVKKESLKLPHLYAVMNNCTDCSGNYLSNSKNALHCFDATQTEDCKYCTLIPMTTKDSCDVSGGGGELLYECFSTGPGTNCRFCGWCWKGIYNLTYCILCMNSSRDLFGCVALTKHNYCILNKQYSEMEYKSLISKIIEQMKRNGEWGEFFPATISPFGYNETSAQENFPLNKEQAITQGFKWSDFQVPVPDLPQKSATEIPETSEGISNDLLNYVFQCKSTGKPFRFIKQELEFHKKHNLPLPRIHPEQRSLNRLALRNPRKLWSRNCAKCNTEIETSYAPDRPEIVYCEKCYLQEVY